jgi:tetratricopeptide (TPR) repeat protein
VTLRRLVWLIPLLLFAGALALLNVARLQAPPTVSAQAAVPAKHAREARLAEIDARFRQGVAMLRAGKNEHAAVAFHRVLELSPRLPEAHVNLGFALLGMERHRAAHDFFLSAIELKPEQANAYYGLALALEKLGDLPGALGAMRTYVHRAPADSAHLRKARAAIWEWEEAAKGKGPVE